VITIKEVRERVERELRGRWPDGVPIAINENTVIEDLGLSSLQISEIVFGLEEDHGVEFDAAQAADARTLGDLLVVANAALSGSSIQQPQADGVRSAR
jgi:acyl carrier protein